MRAGKLRHLVTIQQLVAGSPQQTPSGQPDESWTDFATNVWAGWRTLSGRELFAAQEHHSEIRGVWEMRWRSGVTASMRIVHNGLYYNIHFVPPYDRKGVQADMELLCSEGVNDG